jgi:hypothetical protein
MYVYCPRNSQKFPLHNLSCSAIFALKTQTQILTAPSYITSIDRSVSGQPSLRLLLLLEFRYPIYKVLPSYLKQQQFWEKLQGNASCSHRDNEPDASAGILWSDELSKQFRGRSKDSEFIKFTMSFINNPFQERDIHESAELISSVFKENVSEPEA